jgi:MFS transporter, PAT family, solute carrier family 33 (acetyl-CoA transportor), member 1
MLIFNLGEGSPNVPLLTAVFFSLNFLAATQDIAVDGWALTMLKRFIVSI